MVGVGAISLTFIYDFRQSCEKSGSFHCDESLAVGMLKLLPEYREAVVVRSRNPGNH